MIREHTKRKVVHAHFTVTFTFISEYTYSQIYYKVASSVIYPLTCDTNYLSTGLPGHYSVNKDEVLTEKLIAGDIHYFYTRISPDDIKRS